MNFSFSGRRMDIGESLTTKAKEACESLAKKYGTEFIDANVVMKKDGYLFYSSISVKTASGNSYYASNQADEPKVSFDVTLQKIDLQMQKKKKGVRDKTRIVETIKLDNSFGGQSADSPVIVAEILDDLPLMSVNEAAQQLNEKTKVFVFENVSNNAVNVVYVREDRNIGWIDYKIG